MKKKVLVIDNYDSFTYNLVHLIGRLNVEIEVFRNDKISLSQIRQMNPFAIFISPGPCTPLDAGICIDIIKSFKKEIPIFGVCLGMQSIAQALGGRIINAPTLMHGKTSQIYHQQKAIFAGIKNGFIATRYHSLIVDRTTLPNELEIIAQTSDNIIMGLAHKQYPIFGVQFHPESISSQFGLNIVDNFMKIANKSKSEKIK